MRQMTLADNGFERFRKTTRREQFLLEMDQVIPWRDLCKVINPFCPKPKDAGRPPAGVERMLRIYFLQHWFKLSDSAVEEALYNSRAMRRIVGFDLGREATAASGQVSRSCMMVSSSCHWLLHEHCHPLSAKHLSRG